MMIGEIIMCKDRCGFCSDKLDGETYILSEDMKQKFHDENCLVNYMESVGISKEIDTKNYPYICESKDCGGTMFTSGIEYTEMDYTLVPKLETSFSTHYFCNDYCLVNFLFQTDKIQRIRREV